MAAELVTITNVSKQVIPILVNDISVTESNDDSGIAASVASQMAIAPGAQVVIERQRTDLGQLEQLRRKSLISYT